MIRLKYTGEKQYVITMTKVPLSNPQASPAPLGKRIDELDPSEPKYRIKKEEILHHPNYTENEIVVLKPGINEFENEEQAEYLYKMLGNPEDAGTVQLGVNQTRVVTNKNIIFEVDENGEEIKDHLFAKYRQVIGVQRH